VPLRPAEFENIVGNTNYCVDLAQNFAQTANRPEEFVVLTGEDVLFHTTPYQVASDGTLTAVHVKTAAFARVRALFPDNHRKVALSEWRGLVEVTRLLSRKQKPAAVKC
jgi:4-hydroxy-tetrahydrodipicolinate synthase